jgi:zinc protease
MVNIDWFTEAIPYSLENSITLQAAREILNQLFNRTIREDNSATYGCYANSYMIRGKKNEYLTGLTADCEMQPEKCDSVITLIKNALSSMADGIDSAMFSNAKESLLNSLSEKEKTMNGFWLGHIWTKEDRGINTYTNRRETIENLTPQKVQKFMQRFIKSFHHTETLMQPER